MSFNSLGPNGCECVKSNVWKNSFTARQLTAGDDQSVNVQNNFSLIQVKDHNHAYTDCTCLSYIHTFDLKSWAFILLSDFCAIEINKIPQTYIEEGRRAKSRDQNITETLLTWTSKQTPRQVLFI